MSVLTVHVGCGLGELDTSSVWLVGVPPKQASPQLCLSFPEASAETQLLTRGQWMVPWRGAQPVQARSTVGSYG